MLKNAIVNSVQARGDDFHAISDPKQEERGDLWTNFYIPRDELVTTVRTEELQEHAIQRASRKLMPALHALYSTQQEYESFTKTADLFKLRAVTASGCCTELAAALEEVVVSEVQTEVPYPIPKVIAGELIYFI